MSSPGNLLTTARQFALRAKAWTQAGQLRRRARRSTITVAVLAVLQVVLATVLGRLGVVDQLLSPSGQGAQLLAGLAAAALLTLRLFLVFVAPPLLVYWWIRALLVPSEEQPIGTDMTRRFGQRFRRVRYAENVDPRAIMEHETNR